MDLDWTEEQLGIRDEARRFGATLGGVGDDGASGLARARWDELGRWGYFGMGVPEAYGGSGLNHLTALAATEGLASGCRDTGLMFSAAVQAWVVIASITCFGTEEQKRRYLPGLASGSLIGAFAVTEPDSGSDALAMRTCARRVGDGWTLTGRKAWLTNGPVADLLVCFAGSDRTRMLGGVTAFLVDAQAPGVVREQPARLMGLRTSALGEVALDDVPVPADALLGREGRGLAVFSEVMEHERIGLMGMQLGISERELSETREYARSRHAFGAPIAKHQAVATRLVDMKMRLEVGHMLVSRAAWLKVCGRRATAEAAMAKLWVAEAAIASGVDSMRIHGAYGYSAESGVERRMRDALAGLYYSGTTDMMRAVVAHELEI